MYRWYRGTYKHLYEHYNPDKYSRMCSDTSAQSTNKLEMTIVFRFDSILPNTVGGAVILWTVNRLTSDKYLVWHWSSLLFIKKICCVTIIASQFTSVLLFLVLVTLWLHFQVSMAMTSCHHYLNIKSVTLTTHHPLVRRKHHSQQ